MKAVDPFYDTNVVLYLLSSAVDSKIKSRHTANAVLKHAGLPRQF